MDTLGLTLLGTVAGLCTTASFVPQVVKAWRAGDTQAISLRMYWVSLAAFALWIVHGLMVERLPIVVFNAFNLILGGLVLWLALRGRRAKGVGPRERGTCAADGEGR
jgi:MtN3 and saliva related transmembrane protein